MQRAGPQFGLKSLAVKNLQNLAAGVRSEQKSNVRFRVFGKMAGMLDERTYSVGIADVVLEALLFLWQDPKKIEERYSKCVNVTLQQVLGGTLGVFKSKYYFTDNDDLVLADDGSWNLTDKVKKELFALAGPDAAAKDPAVVEVLLDDWLEWIIASFKESKSNASMIFAKLYERYDRNKDQVLDFKEFSDLLRAAEGKGLEESAVLEMYAQGLELTGQGDSISKEAFVQIALSRHLNLPPDTM